MKTRTAVGIGVGTVIVGIAVAVAAVVVTAMWLSRPAATEAEVVGSWQGRDGATLTVREDHTLTGVNLPFQLQNPRRFTAPWSGEGTWQLIGPGEGSAQHLITILDRHATPIYVRKTHDDVQLYLHDGPSAQGKEYRLIRQ